MVAGVINADGTIDSQSVVVSRTLDPALDSEAVLSMRTAMFWPGCIEGHGVRVRIVMPFTFTSR
jgi:TonB family protein